MLIIATITTPLDRFKLGEFLLPIPQHMRLDATQFAHLTNGEITFGGYRRQGSQHGFSSAIVHLTEEKIQAKWAAAPGAEPSTIVFNFWLA